MLLGITHKSNQTASSLISFLETRVNILSNSEIRINQFMYLNILVEFGTSNAKYFINTPIALEKSLNSDHIQQILNINGYQYGDLGNDIVVKMYKILVFERSVVFIKQKVHGKSSSRSKYMEEDRCKKVADAAKRVIYLLGLDYGMVEIALTGNKKIKIISIEDSPLLKDFEIMSLFAELNKVIQTASAIGEKEVKMGADPEFMLSNARNGDMIPASQFFPREGVVGCDSIRMPNRQQRPIAELRPKPDYSPLQLLSNLDQAMREANKLVPYRNVKWLAGSRPFSGYSIGGHIHFSNIDLNNHILRALDSYVGLPLFLIENQTTAVKRRNKYGFLADYRVKEYGGFEYRTPGSWLVSPQIAAATLCLGKIVASNYLRLSRNCFISTGAQKAFYEGDQVYLRNQFNDIWADVQSLEMYNEYKDQLQVIYDMVKNNIKWEEKEDIRKAWSMSILQRKKSLTSKIDNNAVQTSPSNARLLSANRNDVSSYSNRDMSNNRYNNMRSHSNVFISSQSFF